MPQADTEHRNIRNFIRLKQRYTAQLYSTIKDIAQEGLDEGLNPDEKNKLKALSIADNLTAQCSKIVHLNREILELPEKLNENHRHFKC